MVNVVDLMWLHPTAGPSARDRATPCSGSCSPTHVDVVFSFHGFPGAVHQLVHGRPDADRFHVRGFIEQGTTTTPFDMTVRNKASRYHLVMDAINNAGRTPTGSAELLKLGAQAELRQARAYVVEHLEDMPEVRDWTWQRPTSRSD